MSPFEVVAILTMTVYAIYKQTIISDACSQRRFTTAVIYAVIGVVAGGFMLPNVWAGWALLGISLALSVVVGLVRGRKTDIWMEPDGRVVRRGNVVTVVLFVALIAAKFALGTVAYLLHISDGAGFGEIMVMIAIMIAFQAEIVYRRGQALTGAVRHAPQTA